MFSLRIVSTSHYQAEPVPDLDVTYSSFRSADVKRVPILRIFGATPAGQKTCMHVHGVFPYLYVPYDGTQPVDSYMRRFAASLDKAISVANNSNANNQHVFKISLVSGVPMYGYHADEQQFLKIYMYNPNTIRKAADLLLGGAVMNKSFQPHEAHIPFPLQLFIDYNLYGMNLINVAAVKFRRPKKDNRGHDPKPSTSGGGHVSVSSSPEEEMGRSRTPVIPSLGSSFSSSTPSMQHWDVEDLPSDLLLPSRVERQSVCELEVDVVAADILNRKEVTDNIGGNPGLAALWEDERQRRRDAGQSSQITPQESQEHDNVEVADSEKQLMERLAEIIQQHRALRRSESEESAVSVEDSIQSQSDMSCIPASQLEDHSLPVEDSQGLPLSQQTVIVGDEEGDEMGDEDSAPIISLESIQRVVSFSQSFSRTSSQPSATPAEGEEAADRSLVEVLAALAEESSPASSQHSAAQIAALEEQDSIVGQDVPLPPDEETLQEDEEETLQMSQVMPDEEESAAEDRDEGSQDENANFDLEGLDSTWNESSDNDCSKSKKRLGVRGPVLSAGTSGPGTGAGSSSGEQGVTSPGPQPYGNYRSPGQPQGIYPQNYAPQHQWAGEGSTSTNVMGRPQSGHGQPAGGFGMAGWPQSSPHGSYPAMYGSRGQGQQPGNGYGYYPYPHRQPFSPVHSQGSGSMHGQFSPSHPNFSPPPRSPVSPSYGPTSTGGSSQAFQQPASFPHSQAGGSSQHQGPFAQPQQIASSQAGMAGMRRHSMGSIAPSPQHSPGAMGWPNPRPGFSGPGTMTSPSGQQDVWSPPYSSSAQSTVSHPRESPQHVSELQALLEAPSTSSTSANTATPNSATSMSAVPHYRRTLSADCNANAGAQGGTQAPPEFGVRSEANFKLPEKRSGSFSGSSSMGASTASLQGSAAVQDDKTGKRQEAQDGGETASSMTPLLASSKNERLGKQAKMRKLGLSLQRRRPSAGEASASFHQPSTPLSSPTPSASYTYTFHVPTPVFKRLKVQGVFPPSEREEVKVVRMHPRDARRYSLLKIGREIVKISCLSPREVSNICNTLPVSTSKQKSVRPSHTSLMDPQPGEVVSSSGDVTQMTGGGPETDVLIMQSSRIVGTSRRMVSGRLLGPRCKRKKGTKTEGSTQTVSLSTSSGVGSTGDDGTRQNQNGNEHKTVVSGEVSQAVINTQLTGDTMAPGLQSSSTQSKVCETTPGGASVSGDSSGQWQGPQITSSQQCGPQMSRGNDGFSYPQSSKDNTRPEEKPLQSPMPYQYPSWSAPVCSPSAASPSMSSSQPYPSAASSGQPGASPFPYPHLYGHNYSPYHSAQYSQAASYSTPSGHSNMMPGTYHSSGSGTYHPQTGVQRHSNISSGQGVGQSSFQPGQHNPQYPMASGYPGSQHSGYMSPTTQQSGFGGMGSNVSGFPPQHNGSFSPPAGHGSHASPPVSNYSQMSPVSQHSPMSPPVSATVNHRPQFFPPSSHPGQFSPPAHHQGQFPTFSGQQSQYPNQVPGNQFPHPMQNVSNSSSFSPQSSCNSNFLPPNTQSQPFLTQGACQDTTNRETGPSNPDRPPSSNGPQRAAPSSSSPSAAAARQPLSAASEAPKGLDRQPQHHFTPASESDSSSDTRKPPHDISDLLSMSEKRSKLKQTPVDFLKYQEIMPLDSPKPKKKPSKKDKNVSENLEAQQASEEDSDHDNAFRATSKLSLKGGRKKSKVKNSKEEGMNSVGSSRKKTVTCKSRTESQEKRSRDSAFQNRRRTSVELMSQFDSEDNSDNESDDSCDDYRPGRKVRGLKRKRSSAGDRRRAKRASVNYGRNAFAQFLREEVEETNSCRGRRKNSKHDKKKREKLIEGIHYIVVGKFKGHRIMLVKVNRVKVTLNERVKVSEWLGCSGPVEAESHRQPTKKDSILGNTQRRPRKQNCVDNAVGTAATNNSPTLQEFEDASGFISDASTIVEDTEGELLNRTPSDDKTVEECNELDPDRREESSDTPSISRPVVESSTQKEAKQKAVNDHGMAEQEPYDTEQPAEDSSVPKNCSSESDVNESVGSSLSQAQDCPERVVTSESELKEDSVGENDGNDPTSQPVKEKDSLKECLQQEVVGIQNVHMDAEVKEDDESPLAVDQIRKCDPDPETETGATSDPPGPAVEEKGAGKAASSAAEMPRSAAPVSKPGKLLIDSPSVVYQSASGEHSQDADCSSLPHSNPESNSSSPVFPRMSFSSNQQCNSRDSEHSNQSKSESKHLDLEQRDSEKKCPDTFCFQISRKVKETCKPLQDLDDSSDSTDSNACFSDGPTYRDDAASSGPVSFSGKEKLTRIEGAETEKDKLKKQKQLTTNQRLGVAFLSKKRKKVKAKVPVRKVGRPRKNPKGESATSKLMNSLSVLHMATLASLEGEQSTAEDSQKFSENVIKVTDNSVLVTESIVKVNENIVKVSENIIKVSEGTIKVSENTDATTENNDKVLHFGDKVFKNGKEIVDDSSKVTECRVTESSYTASENKGEIVCDNSDSFIENSENASESNNKVIDTDSVRENGDSTQSTQSQGGQNPRSRKRLLKRKKTPKSKKPSKLMNSLSLLHMATLANLEDQPVTIHKDTAPPRSCDAASDDSDKYQDSLKKMSYISPVDSDKGDSSPPVPLTPEDLKKRNKGVKHKSASSGLRFEENLGTCALRVSELRADPSGMSEISLINHGKCTSIPLPSSHRPPVSQPASDSDSDGSVLSDTIPHISTAVRQQSPKSSDTAKLDMLAGGADAEPAHTEQQPSRVLAERTNCLSQFASTQDSLNMKEMVSKSSAYAVSNMSIRDLFNSSRQSGTSEVGENRHSVSDDGDSVAGRFSSDFGRSESVQVDGAREKRDQHKVPCGIPLTLDVSDANGRYEHTKEKTSPHRVYETGRESKHGPLDCHVSGPHYTREVGMSRTERIISQMFGVDPKQVKDKPSPTASLPHYSHTHPTPTSPRGYRSEGLLMSQDRNTWHQRPGWDDRAQGLYFQTGDKNDRHWSQAAASKSPGSSLSPGRSRMSVDGADNHFAKTLVSSPGSYARNHGSVYDYSGKVASLSPSRYAVSPKSLNEYTTKHSSLSQSKYGVSPRSMDECLEKHYSTSPGRYASTSPGRYTSTSPGRYGSASPGRYTSTSPARYAVSPRSKDEYMGLYSGLSVPPSKYGSVSPQSAGDHSSRHASLSPGRYSQSPGSSRHSGLNSSTSPGRYPTSPGNLQTDYAYKHASMSPGRYGASHSGKTADRYFSKASAVSPSKSSTSPGAAACHSDKGMTSEQLQFNKQRSIGDYLDEMIESAFAELSPGMDKTLPKLPEFSDSKRTDQGSFTVCSRPLTTMPEGLQAFQAQYTVPKGAFDGRTDVTFTDKAIDLSAPKRSTAAPSSGSKAAPSVAKTTTVVNHPTWTTVKTDKFENITDDEDEDVIPSSQEYPTNVYRFPGFGRLPSSSSPAWNSFITSSKSSVVPVSAQTPGRKASSEVQGPEVYKASSVSSGNTSSDGANFSQNDPRVYGSSSSTHSMYKSYLTGPANSSALSSYGSVYSQSAPLSLVTSFGTPWRDTQAQTSTANTSMMSNFEPITDSEDEDCGKSPPKSAHRENRALSSSWLTSHSGRAPYSFTGLMNRGVDRVASHSQSELSYSLENPITLSQSSVPYSSISGWGRTAVDYAQGLDCSVSSSVINSGVGSVSQLAQGDPISEQRKNGDRNHLEATATTYRCAGDNGGKDSDDDQPEDGGGGKKRKKTTSGASSDNASSSSRGPEGGSHQGGGHGDPPQHPGTPSDGGESPGSSWPGRGSTKMGHRYVLCPKAPPPSRELVDLTAVSHGLSAESATRAFCSNPADLPDRPRELGGRVLRIGTNRVAELEEVALPSGVTSLREWQTLLAAESDVLPSQASTGAGSVPESLRDRLHQDPQLRCLLTGDSPCVITPVLPPPSHAAVSAWIEEKLKGLVDIQSEKEVTSSGVRQKDEESARSSDTETSTLVDEPSVLSTSGEEEALLFTKLREKEGKGGVISEATSAAPPTQKDSQAEDEEAGSPPKRPRLESDGVMHSTPVRRASAELFETGCTPIASVSSKDSSAQPGEGEGKSSEGAARDEFVTPKRPPLRRLSTNTESALRRAIHTSQPKFEGFTSQIDGPTPKNTHGFKVTQQKLQDAKALHKHQFLTVLSMELHVDTRGDLMPDPEVDPIRIVFYAVFDDIPPERGPRSLTGAIVVDAESCDVGDGGSGQRPSTSRVSATPPGGKKHKLLEKCGVQGELDIAYVATEADLLQHLIQLVNRLDPDILLGFEVQQQSWGFLLKRAAHLSVNLCAQISRIQGSKQGNRFRAERDEWGADHTSEIHIEGRIMLNLWRVLRHEVTLNIYSYENCAFHILHHRVPTYSFRTLTFWYNHRTDLLRWRVIHHYTERVKGQLAMLDQLDIIGKTSEFSRVFGIEFYDVLSRGSQPLNFIPVSPSVQQRARQKAAECIPLTLEPESRFYVDPVVVLDFQSLYPSIMIAYNYCFSTCLGRLEHLSQAHEGPFEFGCTSLNVPPATLKKLRKDVTISPNGCVFVTQRVRRGVLPMMVEEILKTRLMVKKSMKDYKDDKTLHRMLDARQLGLKLIANVTYGYTGASFSGRMPCIEVGDSIVRKARESLERAIRLVEETPHWRARVVYGDTDSLFILMPGRTKDQAFVLGQEIADTISNMFPKPMKLKFEKVYLPCVLQTKKRYVGFMYETRDQQQPVFDAKGIETVRRDNCGVVSKVLEKCIKMLFTMRDVSLVRAYLQRQFTKMLSGRVGLQDYIFAKEYRGMMGYKPGACVPALEIAKRRLKDDRRAEPRVGERVPYVIVHGSPGLPLIQLVRQPGEVLRDTALRINVVYYITKQVLPPLDRLFGLIGVSVFQWYNDMPKVIRMAPSAQPAQDTRQGTISQYFVTSDCLVCERQTKQPVCSVCLQDPQLVAVTLASRSATWEAVHDHLSQVCFTCMGTQDLTQPCVSLDCPVLFRRHLAAVDLTRAEQQREAMIKSLTF
ncbi:hypothetical protein BaRGS_00015611 [Batillaria attramentaria]|uniref:DNA polymerase zeta catalytic subunit n=1 Tax=Batillaria attramentaria TaxID=370345 RepID=A0ABD0L1U5_9CAEN